MPVVVRKQILPAELQLASPALQICHCVHSCGHAPVLGLGEVVIDAGGVRLGDLIAQKYSHITK